MELTDAEAETPEGEEPDVLAVLESVYEDKQYLIGMTSVISSIEFPVEQAGSGRRDLMPFIGSRQRVSEFLASKRDNSSEEINR